ncbi:MAG: beta-galactosidase, partial [Cellvibrio sp.]|nr:beta-galactosidase [Cellvibrio sp.]
MVIGYRINSFVQPMLALCLLMVTVPALAASLPELVNKNGRHALLVDGAPFLMLGAQTNNSSNYPAALKDV